MIVFFISGHGFGHASRQVEVLNALGPQPPGSVVVRSAVSPALLERTVRVPIDLRSGPCDTGVLQASSVEQDEAATVAAAVRFYEDFDARVEDEARALGPGVRLVVGDIPPLAFAVADRLGVPGIAIGNFTWDWIYDGFPGFGDAPWIAPRIRAAYGQASLALELPFSAGFEIFPNVQRLPLIARRPSRAPADTRAHFRVPLGRPAALLSFGGYGLPALDVTTLDCLRDWTIVTTDRVTPPQSGLPASIVTIDEREFQTSGFRYEDLVAAVDVVVTKPGYGIIAECIAAGTAMLYTSRGLFREYDLLVEALPRYVRSRFISHADLFSGRWRATLEALMQQSAAPDTMALDGAEVAARIIRTRVGKA